MQRRKEGMSAKWKWKNAVKPPRPSGTPPGEGNGKMKIARCKLKNANGKIPGGWEGKVAKVEGVILFVSSKSNFLAKANFTIYAYSPPDKSGGSSTIWTRRCFANFPCEGFE